MNTSDFNKVSMTLLSDNQVSNLQQIYAYTHLDESERVKYASNCILFWFVLNYIYG